ncbi:MAG: winged helix-turn-helix domain-containing protein, partial [Flavipsychrobacter sp.]
MMKIVSCIIATVSERLIIIIWMAVPQYDDLMAPTIRALQALNGQAHIRDIEDKVSEILGLSTEDLEDIHRGTRTKFSYRLAWARNYLKRYGLMDKVSRGIWKLTFSGENIIDIDKEEIKKAVKKKYDYFEDAEDDVLEIEDQDDESNFDGDDIISPFDPKDIKIIVEPKTIDHLVTRLRYEEIDLNTEFQRKGNLWKPEVQSRLIESILLRLPLPAFYFDASNDNKWLVVDGLQRLWSIKNFIVNSEINNEQNLALELRGLEILVDYSDKGVTFDKLNRAMQRRILETPITTYLIQPGTPKQVKYNVFRRINTGGLGLNAMEIRNALNQGKPSDFLKYLSEDIDLKSVLRLQDKRMEDRELLLRAYAFINRSYLEYTSPLSTFLDNAMESLDRKSNNELDELAFGIIDAVDFQVALFDKHIFSRSILGGKFRVKLNSALFEVWVSQIYKLNTKEKEALIKNKSALILDYRALLLNENFVRAVATSTSG